jgi:acyl dehydratase
MSFDAPIGDRWFEDYVPGTVHEFGSMEVEEDEVLAFGRRFDPQPFHTDPAAAARTEYAGLIASGWHTLVSPGIDEIRWLLAVRPGDVLSLRVTVLEARRSRSRPDRGLVRSAVEVLNQRGETVMTLTGLNFFRCRGA